jgi:hypothetical protein
MTSEYDTDRHRQKGCSNEIGSELSNFKLIKLRNNFYTGLIIRCSVLLTTIDTNESAIRGYSCELRVNLDSGWSEIQCVDRIRELYVISKQSFPPQSL